MFKFILPGVCLLAVSHPLGADRLPDPSPTSSTSPAQPEERWKQIELYRTGQKAYAEKNYVEALKQLAAFKAVNQAIFSAPPADLQPVVKEISDAIAYSQAQLTKKPAPRIVAPKKPVDPDQRLDGIHSGGKPGVSGKNSDKGVLRGAHDDFKSEKKSSSADKGGSDKAGGSSVRERP